jgi:hypothetical protein
MLKMQQKIFYGGFFIMSGNTIGSNDARYVASKNPKLNEDGVKKTEKKEKVETDRARVDTTDRNDVRTNQEDEDGGGTIDKFKNFIKGAEQSLRETMFPDTLMSHDNGQTTRNNRVEEVEERFEPLTENGWDKEKKVDDDGNTSVNYTKEIDGEEWELDVSPGGYLSGGLSPKFEIQIGGEDVSKDRSKTAEIMNQFEEDGLEFNI